MDAAAPEKAGKKQLLFERFEANFYIDSKVSPPVHTYIITEQGSPEIIARGETDSREQAISEAMSHMSDLAKKSRR